MIKSCGEIHRVFFLAGFKSSEILLQISPPHSILVNFSVLSQKTYFSWLIFPFQAIVYSLYRDIFHINIDLGMILKPEKNITILVSSTSQAVTIQQKGPKFGKKLTCQLFFNIII